MMEYFMCTGCGKEFFAEKDFKEHSCFNHSADPNGKISKMSSPVAVSNVGKTEAQKQAETTVEVQGTSPVSALDLRMDAKKELINMKKVLVANNIDCQTLNETETKVEYDKLMAKLDGGKPKDFTAAMQRKTRARKADGDADKPKE